MTKKCICIFFALFLLIGCSLPVAAYEPPFTVSARTALVASLDTGEILYEKNSDQKVYPASITKIMTTILILESDLYEPTAKVAMTEEVLRIISGTGSSVSNMVAGEQISQLDLVYTVLMASFGDCAYLAAITYGGSVDGFVEMMNEKARELGLTGTHYGNPVGLHDELTYTTAKDTLTLTSYALKNETFKTICESTRHTIPATNVSPQRTLSTTNFLQDNTTNYYYTYARGVKTGFTDEAGRCLVSTASYNGYNYITILFGCPAGAARRYEFVDSAEIYRWAFNNFEFKEIANTQNPVTEMPVELSFDTDFVPLYVEKGFVSVLPIEADESTITINPKLSAESVDAPIKKGEILGTADIIYAEKVIGTVNLVAGQDVEKNVLLEAARAVKQFFSSIYMKLVYIVIALAIAVFVIVVILMNTGRSKRRRVKYIPYKEGNDKYENF